MKQYLIGIICISCLTAWAEEGKPLPAKSQEAEPADQLAVTFVNNNSHTIEVHNERKDVCDCTPFFGNQFKECMGYVSTPCYKRNLATINDRARARYAQDLTIREIQQLKESLTDLEWRELRQEQPDFMGIIEGRLNAWNKVQEQLKKDKEMSYTQALALLLLGVVCWGGCQG